MAGLFIVLATTMAIAIGSVGLCNAATNSAIPLGVPWGNRELGYIVFYRDSLIEYNNVMIHGTTLYWRTSNDTICASGVSGLNQGYDWRCQLKWWFRYSRDSPDTLFLELASSPLIKIKEGWEKKNALTDVSRGPQCGSFALKSLEVVRLEAAYSSDDGCGTRFYPNHRFVIEKDTGGVTHVLREGMLPSEEFDSLIQLAKLACIPQYECAESFSMTDNFSGWLVILETDSTTHKKRFQEIDYHMRQLLRFYEEKIELRYIYGDADLAPVKKNARKKTTFGK